MSKSIKIGFAVMLFSGITLLSSSLVFAGPQGRCAYPVDVQCTNQAPVCCGPEDAPRWQCGICPSSPSSRK